MVGEERITQYLLAILNIRGTPLHWSHLSNRTEVSQNESDGKHEYNLKDLRPKRRKPPNVSDVLYIEVMKVSLPLKCGWHRLYRNFLHRIVTSYDHLELYYFPPKKLFSSLVHIQLVCYYQNSYF